MQDLVGRAWGRFQIIEERGRGGMAVVYRAYDSVLQRTVALKVLLPFLAANTDFTRRFEREAITAANLRHPNIVVIYDVGAHDSFQYIVMEFLDGLTLQQHMQRTGAVSVARALPVLGQLASALDYAHQQSLIHRDVKPANVIIGGRDHVTLTDFGLVKALRLGSITAEGAASGTLRYMSPEQALGKELDGRTDVYSLGIVAYEMLTGDAPFSGTTPYQALRELIQAEPPPPSRINPAVDPRAERAILQALAKDPARRFSTAGEFVEALATATGLGATLERARVEDTSPRQIVLHLTTADGREYPVSMGSVTIGRDTSNDIVLPTSQVSRHHARIDCDQMGCRVSDAGSTNGTFLNGNRLSPGTAFPLRPGDVLGIGPVNLLVVRPKSRGHFPGTEIVDIRR